LRARDIAIAAVTPVIGEVVQSLGLEKARATLPVLRELRMRLSSGV